MTNKIDFYAYGTFVETLTSTTSKDLTSMMNRLDELDANYESYGSEGEYMHGPNINVPLYFTSAMGMCSESGEFMEIAKKCLWQGKEFSEETKFHAKRELGDIIFYWMQACRALGFDPNDVIAENVKKLEARYPGGKFDVFYSENRKEGDL
jgi:NTP pyrophosphatase (non-canonical NTP hydrolase)